MVLIRHTPVLNVWVTLTGDSRNLIASGITAALALIKNINAAVTPLADILKKLYFGWL